MELLYDERRIVENDFHTLAVWIHTHHSALFLPPCTAFTPRTRIDSMQLIAAFRSTQLTHLAAIEQFSCGCSPTPRCTWAFFPMKTPPHSLYGTPINRKIALDFVLLSLYFAMLLFIGFYVKRSANTSEEFFRAGHEMTAWIAGLSFVGAHPGSLKPRSLKPRSLKAGSLKLMGWIVSAYLLWSRLATLGDMGVVWPSRASHRAPQPSPNLLVGAADGSLRRLLHHSLPATSGEHLQSMRIQ